MNRKTAVLNRQMLLMCKELGVQQIDYLKVQGKYINRIE
jgi:hypothetical protein